MRKGIFWCKNAAADPPELITVSVVCDPYGVSAEPILFSSKSRENFNHQAEWMRKDKNITEGQPFHYYPRGRVEIKNGRAVIFLNPDINSERILAEIENAFELSTADGLKEIQIKSDGSKHYRYSCADRLLRGG